MQQHNTLFVLPDDLTLGGVTTWSVETCLSLRARAEQTALIKHTGRFNPPVDIRLPSDIRIVDLSGYVSPSTRSLSPSDLLPYLPGYQRMMPGVVIPNWSVGAYGTCAMPATSQPETLRVIGIAHTDSADYYQLLTYYEPIIHQFIAVSDEIAVNLKELLPHRAAEIAARPYGIRVVSKLSRAYRPSGKPLQLVYGGRLDQRQKRVLDLLVLAETLQSENVAFVLRIYGGGSEEECLARRIERLSAAVRRRIHLMGITSPVRMRGIWKQADICLLVSAYEGTSIAMLEAMAQGCVPVVTKWST